MPRLEWDNPAGYVAHSTIWPCHSCHTGTSELTGNVSDTMQAKPGPPTERMIVYVDGFNLYYGMHQRFVRSTLWLDLVALAQSFRPRQQLLIVRYFTASVLNDPAGQSRQGHYIDALETRYPGRFLTVMGRYQSKRHTCKNCGHTYQRPEEKETDVNIATSIVTDAARNAMDTAIIVSGDSDLAPAVRAAKALRPNLFITAAFPPGRRSVELQTLMPSSFTIGDNKIRQHQLEDSFTAGGRTFNRPDYWR